MSASNFIDAIQDVSMCEKGSILDVIENYSEGDAKDDMLNWLREMQGITSQCREARLAVGDRIKNGD
jgi:hypothetical protein